MITLTKRLSSLAILILAGTSMAHASAAPKLYKIACSNLQGDQLKILVDQRNSDPQFPWAVSGKVSGTTVKFDASLQVNSGSVVVQGRNGFVSASSLSINLRAAEPTRPITVNRYQSNVSVAGVANQKPISCSLYYVAR